MHYIELILKKRLFYLSRFKFLNELPKNFTKYILSNACMGLKNIYMEKR